MSQFEIEKYMVSCKVTKPLLDSIRKYLIEKKDALQVHKSKPPALDRFRIAITDDLGKETVASTEEMRPSRFLDSTKEVRVSFECTWYEPKTSIEVSLKFDTDRIGSRITVATSGDGARELGHAVYKALSDIIQTNRTGNWKYYPPAHLEGAILGLSACGFLIGLISAFGSKSTASLPLLAFGLLAFIYGVLGKRLHPYNIFDSSRGDRLQKTGEWFERGLFTLILFGSVLTLFRRQLLGF